MYPNYSVKLPLTFSNKSKTETRAFKRTFFSDAPYHSSWRTAVAVYGQQHRSKHYLHRKSVLFTLYRQSGPKPFLFVWLVGWFVVAIVVAVDAVAVVCFFWVFHFCCWVRGFLLVLFVLNLLFVCFVVFCCFFVLFFGGCCCCMCVRLFVCLFA